MRDARSRWERLWSAEVHPHFLPCVSKSSRVKSLTWLSPWACPQPATTLSLNWRACAALSQPAISASAG